MLKWLKRILCSAGVHDLDIIFEDRAIAVFKCRKCGAKVEHLKFRK